MKREVINFKKKKEGSPLLYIMGGILVLAVCAFLLLLIFSYKRGERVTPSLKSIPAAEKLRKKAPPSPETLFEESRTEPAFSTLEKLKKSRTPSTSVKEEDRLCNMGMKLAAQRKFSQAKDYFLRALEINPDHERSLLGLAKIELIEGNYDKVLEYLLRPSAYSENPELHYLLALAFYYKDKNDQAADSLKRALQLKPDFEKARTLLRKIERETRIEGTYYSTTYSNFKVMSNEKISNSEVVDQILRYLHEEFNRLTYELDFSPRQQITVFLYPQQDFERVTNSPYWVGGLNDGKIRIPLKGVSYLNEELKRVLTHELVHSFLRMKTSNHCPVWLHEGLARMLSEDDLTSEEKVILRKAVQEGKAFKIKQLEGSFLRLGAIPAVKLAYAESFSVVQYLRENYSTTRINRLLEELASSTTTEEALKKIFKLDYSSLQSRWQDFVLSSY